MVKSIQFFAIVKKIESFAIDVERTRERIMNGLGLDSLCNTKRYQRGLEQQRAMRAFLMTSASFEQRYRGLYKHQYVERFMDRRSVNNGRLIREVTTADFA